MLHSLWILAATFFTVLTYVLCVREVGAAAVRNLGHFLRPFLLHGFLCRSDGGGC